MSESGWDFRNRMRELNKHREFMRDLIKRYDNGLAVCYKREDRFILVNEVLGSASNEYPGKQIAGLEFWDENAAKDFIKWIELTIRFHGDVA